MNRFLALGVAALFAFALTADLNAQCCGTSGYVAAPSYSSGCCNTGYVVATPSYNSCNTCCAQPRQGFITRMRARRASTYCCAQPTCCPQPTNCCAQVNYSAPMARFGTRFRTRRATNCCGNAMYTSTVSGCGTGCGTGCGGQPVMMQGTMQGTIIEGEVTPGPEGNVVTPPTPDDT